MRAKSEKRLMRKRRNKNLKLQKSRKENLSILNQIVHKLDIMIFCRLKLKNIKSVSFVFVLIEFEILELKLIFFFIVLFFHLITTL